MGGAVLLTAGLGLATLSVLTLHYRAEVVGGYLLALAWWSVLMVAVAERARRRYADVWVR